MSKQNKCRYNVGFENNTPQLRDANGVTQVYGCAVPYNVWSKPLFGGAFREMFKPGAFTNYLNKRENELFACVCHDTKTILSRRSTQTLEITDTAEGLHIVSEIPNTTYARDLIENIKAKNIKGMSFFFEDIKDDWIQNPNMREHIVYEAEIYEVSFVFDPAYTDTTAGMRSLATLEDIMHNAKIKEQKEFVPDDVEYNLVRRGIY